MDTDVVTSLTVQLWFI